LNFPLRRPQGKRRTRLPDTFHNQEFLQSVFSFMRIAGRDPGGQIRASIKTDLAMVSGANTDWPQLIAAGEKLGIRIEEEEDNARQQQQQQQQMLMP
jgi:hypothetical protein